MKENYCRNDHGEYVCCGWLSIEPLMETCAYYERDAKAKSTICKWSDNESTVYMCKNEEAQIELKMELL